MVREALTSARLRAMPTDEAAALFAVRRAEGLTESEQALLAEWLTEPVHARAFEQIERGWDAFDEAGDDEILAAMREHALAPRARGGLHWPQVAAVAAMLLVVVAVGLWFMLPQPRQETPQVAWARYEAPASQVRPVTLADGSVMTLDAGSAAEARFVTDGRAIRLLRGRALFEVSHDPARPFGVTAARRRIVALGTRFEVDLGGDALKVTLLRGKVAVEPVGIPAKTVTLAPGQQFIERGGAASVGTVPMLEAPAWSRGLLDLDDVPLGAAVAEINRYAQDHIVIRDAGVSALRVSGQFRAGEAARFANTVAELHDLRVIRRGSEIELVRK
ncbi:FecR domain-containing protein [Sphingomonas sp. KR3-1]|uniref:FecR family protein n=1 Tax=Sphingomonas sp. KR3-1 TaxID=3156611 RepID=UPI0032B5024F